MSLFGKIVVCVWWLRDFDGYSGEDVAVVLGLYVDCETLRRRILERGFVGACQGFVSLEDTFDSNLMERSSDQWRSLDMAFKF